MNSRTDLVAVSAANPELQGLAEALAVRLGVPCVTSCPESGFTSAVLLRFTGSGLEAHLQSMPDAAPVRVDFAAGAIGHRLRAGGGETLVRALGLKSVPDARVLDATGGLGRDAILMARAGLRVTLCERCGPVYALLEDALQRAAQDSALLALTERMQLLPLDARDHLADPACRYDVIYLDPMFPERSKSALVRKEQRLLQALAGHGEEDASALARLALARADRRVVVKRPRQAPTLLGKPDVVYAGKKIRFDVYFPAREFMTQT